MIVKEVPTPRRRGRPLASEGSGKQRVLEAAERLFSSRGFDHVSAADIAQEAGVAYGLLFHHFGSMQGLYVLTSQGAVERMDAIQLKAFKGSTPRDRVRSFLTTHMRLMKQRKGDAIFRARTFDIATGGQMAAVWEGSRERAIEGILEALGIESPASASRVALRAWLGFHDQLVLGWLAGRSISQQQVLDWTLGQLDKLATQVLGIDLERAAPSDQQRAEAA